MSLPSFARFAGALVTVAVYVAACIFAIPLLALDGAQCVRRWLGVRP